MYSVHVVVISSKASCVCVCVVSVCVCVFQIVRTFKPYCENLFEFNYPKVVAPVAVIPSVLTTV